MKKFIFLLFYQAKKKKKKISSCSSHSETPFSTWVQEEERKINYRRKNKRFFTRNAFTKLKRLELFIKFAGALLLLYLLFTPCNKRQLHFALTTLTFCNLTRNGKPTNAQQPLRANVVDKFRCNALSFEKWWSTNIVCIRILFITIEVWEQ